MIPKLLHFIWVGDETRRPDNCIDTWRALHPDWQIRLWGNAELNSRNWVNKRHMAAMYQRELNGVADMMRWEIVHELGGIVLDADSIGLRKLDDFILDCDAFACWENEIARPGLIAAGYFGCIPGNPFVKQIITDIANAPSVIHDMAWKTVGPLRLTESYQRYQYTPMRIYPSHYFIPQHFSGITYQGRDAVYAHQLWGSTRRAYDEIHKLDIPAILQNPDG
jgi:mannosyltransferase OCH1-like enzyme